MTEEMEAFKRIWKNGGVCKMINVEWHEKNNIMLGYKWSIQAKYGIVSISQEELFSRVEFQCQSDHNDKILYAVHLGWRYNIDNGNWYRIKGH